VSTGAAWVAPFLQREALPESYREVIEQQIEPLGRDIAARALPRGDAGERPLVVGICGAQGSGKSTLTAALSAQLSAEGLRVAGLSLDDLYLTRAERQQLARTVQPLLATRGVPGTHDVGLGTATFAALGRSGPVALPAFDKSIDDRRPPEAWPRVEGPVQVILFEGWCVGAVPQGEAALATPVNALERDEDSEGIWRRHVNDALKGSYRELFGAIDTLVLLQAPSFEVVFRWRQEQERKLERRLAASGASGAALMDAGKLARFVAHYERLTRHILDEMPGRADVLFELDEQRRMTRRR
jgi:D-glycerate 3-kinase